MGIGWNTCKMQNGWSEYQMMDGLCNEGYDDKKCRIVS